MLTATGPLKSTHASGGGVLARMCGGTMIPLTATHTTQ